MSPDGKRASYGELVAAQLLHFEARPDSKLKSPARFSVMTRSVPRIDIPEKVTGGAAFIQDMRLPGMLHARVVRPPSYAARLTAIDLASVERLPGVVKAVRDGNFLTVVAEREFQAVKAMRAMAEAARWEEKPGLPSQDNLTAMLLSLPTQDSTLLDQQAVKDEPVRHLEASYSRPYLAHGSVGPSCAVAHLENGVLTLWTHTQGVHPLRQAIAEMLDLQIDKIHCVHMQGAGCYGHNGADDAAADAALIASLLPGRPIRAQWMRDQEHGWEPFGAAMVTVQVRKPKPARGRQLRPSRMRLRTPRASG